MRTSIYPPTQSRDLLYQLNPFFFSVFSRSLLVFGVFSISFFDSSTQIIDRGFYAHSRAGTPGKSVQPVAHRIIYLRPCSSCHTVRELSKSMYCVSRWKN